MTTERTINTLLGAGGAAKSEKEEAEVEDEDGDEDYVPHDDDENFEEEGASETETEAKVGSKRNENLDTNNPLKRKCVESSKEIQSVDVDSLWADMKASSDKSTTPTFPKLISGGNPTIIPPKASPATKVTEVYKFAGEKVTEIPTLHKKQPPVKRGNALDNLVSSLSGKKKQMSVLDKSKLDWNKFKTTTGITNELEHHKKNGYLEKVAFLQRADQKQYEKERELRLSKKGKGGPN